MNIVELFKEAEKPAKKYVSIIFFWLSTSQLPWVRFAARSLPHLGQNLNETCKDPPHVEQNIASRKEKELRNRFLFLCQDLGSWGECVVKISKCVAKISKCVAKILKCVAKISEFVVNSKCVSKNWECVVHYLKCVLNNSKCVVK